MNRHEIIDRVYADYFQPSRMDEYKELLRALLLAGYKFHSIHSFWRLEHIPGGLAETGKYFVLRHDIDSDVQTAKKMWAIEKEMGIASSYYFRLSTIDITLMRDIDANGSDYG